MSHDQRCLDSNRFGDGFDCICEPDWKAECARLKQAIKEIEDPRNAYGLSLAVEQEKVRLLTAAADKAITWLVTVKADQPAGIIAERARLALEALQAVGR